MIASAAQLEYTPRGAAAELFTCREPKVLLQGPAGTGKSRAILEYINYWCGLVPNVRAMICRKTRVSLTESGLVTFENKVLPPNSPMKRGAARSHRKEYKYPNGSVLVPLGLDNPERTFSTEWDIVYVQEATEVTEQEAAKLERSLRNGVLPFQQLIMDCNPDSEFHWLKRRVDDGSLFTLYSRHQDNPTVTEDYLNRLDRLPEPLRSRLFLGKWVSAEGVVYENYDPAIHLIDRRDVPKIEWAFGAIDWGWNDPFVFQVWGVADGCIYRLAEIYKGKLKTDQAAEWIRTLIDQHDIRWIVADPSRPDWIDLLNDRLQGWGKRASVPGDDGHYRMIHKAFNGIEEGIDTMRIMLGNPGIPRDEEGGPRMFFVRDATVHGRDQDRDSHGLPCSTEEELPSYVFDRDENKDVTKEKPDPDCEDHGCDTARYAVMSFWKRDKLKFPDKPKQYNKGTLGHLLEHDF